MADRSPGVRPLALIVLDGWGCAPAGPANALDVAHTPTMDRLLRDHPHTTVEASGTAVGLPAGQIGNSEVGHINIGAGYTVLQDLPRIDHEIETGSFFENPALVGAMKHAAVASGESTSLHLMGLYSRGGVHSHAAHLRALVEMAEHLGVSNILIHLFLDGRDVPPREALEDVHELERWLGEHPSARIGTVMGRFYAMDRDNRWDRTEAAYRALTSGEGERANSASGAIERSYEADVGDEFVRPTIVGDPTRAIVRPGDAVIFFNFRADRARQITRAFVSPQVDGFRRDVRPQPLHFVSFAEYEDGLPVTGVAFPPIRVERPLARVVSESGLRQLHVAETEKYAHVTYFLNGGREDAFPNEERVLIASPRVRTYDLQPEMSASGVAEAAASGLRDGFSFVAVNFANPDMVGHTGVMEAAVRAAEVVDAAIEKVTSEALRSGGAALVTADHGNAEEMVDVATGEPKTAHTTNPVPVILVGLSGVKALRTGGRLSDVAPTVLEIMDLPIPDEMTARSLVVWEE